MSENTEIKIDLGKFAEMCAAIGAQAAIQKLDEEEKRRNKTRHDRRLYNTELLFRNYRKLTVHRNDSVYSLPKALEILSELDKYEFEEDLFVESIKKSTERTAIVISHIDKMLQSYRYICELSTKPEDLRRYKSIYALYIEEPQRTIEEIYTTMGVSQSQFYRDKGLAFENLCGFIFGVDSLKMK